MFGFGHREVALFVAASFAVFTGIEMALATAAAHIFSRLGRLDTAGNGFVGLELSHTCRLIFLLYREEGRNRIAFFFRRCFDDQFAIGDGRF